MKGDCLIKVKEIQDNSIHLCVTSPPYHTAKNYSAGVGNMGASADYLSYLDNMGKVIKELYRVLKQEGVVCWNTSPVVCGETRHYIPYDTHNLFLKEGFVCEEIVYWVKPDGAGKLRVGGWWQNGGRPTTYHSNAVVETIGIYKKPGKRETKEFENIKTHYPDGIPKDLLTDAWKFNPDTTCKFHPATYPKELVKRCILLYSYPGDTILDTYLGSGTTMLVARELNRNSIGIELSDEYYEKAKQKIGFYQKPLFGEIIYEEK